MCRDTGITVLWRRINPNEWAGATAVTSVLIVMAANRTREARLQNDNSPPTNMNWVGPDFSDSRTRSKMARQYPDNQPCSFCLSNDRWVRAVGRRIGTTRQETSARRDDTRKDETRRRGNTKKRRERKASQDGTRKSTRDDNSRR